MPRIQPLDQNTADPATEALLGSVRKSMGAVPNLIATMARSPAVAGAYLGFAQASRAARCPVVSASRSPWWSAKPTPAAIAWRRTRRRGRRSGLTEEETKEARRAASDDEKEQAALVFARKVVQDRGVVADDDVEQLRRAGYTDGEVGEIVANVALSLFTNYFNHVAATEVDFPAAPDLAAVTSGSAGCRISAPDGSIGGGHHGPGQRDLAGAPGRHGPRPAGGPLGPAGCAAPRPAAGVVPSGRCR